MWWSTVWGLAPNACPWALAPNLLTQKLQRQGSHRDPQGPHSRGLDAWRVYISNVMSGDIHTVGLGTYFENDILVDREGRWKP